MIQYIYNIYTLYNILYDTIKFSGVVSTKFMKRQRHKTYRRYVRIPKSIPTYVSLMCNSPISRNVCM